MPAAARAADPGLAQLPGRAGCISDTGSKGKCARGRGLKGVGLIVLSPDGRNVYALSGALTVFRRDRATGRIFQLPGGKGCLAASYLYRPGSGCARLAGVEDTAHLAVSPDGRNVYVSSGSYDDPAARSVIALTRDPRDGTLTPVAGGCVNENGANGCSVAGPLYGGELVVSPDGKQVYVVGGRGVRGPRPGIVILRRDPGTGALSQPARPAGCVSDDPAAGCAPGRALSTIQGLAFSPDGLSLYAAGSFEEFPAVPTSPGVAAGTLAALARDPATGVLSQPGGVASCHRTSVPGTTYPPANQCLLASELLAGLAVTVSPDGRNVYVTTGAGDPYFQSALLTFVRDPATGLLTYPAGSERCLLAGGSVGSTCVSTTEGVGGDIAVTPDGRRLYVGCCDGVSVFARDPSTGTLSQSRGLHEECAAVSDGGSSCSGGRALFGATGIAVSRDGSDVYVASPGGFVGRHGEEPVEGGLAVLVRPVVSIVTPSVRSVRGGRVRIDIRCLADRPGERCRGDLALRSTRRLRLGRGRPVQVTLGSRAFTIPAGAKRAVAVPLSKRGSGVLGAHRRLAVLATARAHGATGHTYTATRSLRLTSPRPR